MARNEIVPQYYNLFDSTKGYTEILFRAGKVLQSKELNELQSILKNQIKNVGNSILTDGDVIEGCQLIISDDRTVVTMTKGRIYLDGDIRDVPDTIINISGQGTETIGAKLETVIITSDEDSTLNDIATGYDNYNQDGGYRLKETVKITLDDPNASILYVLTNGEQIALNSNEDLTQLDKINSTLARRTFEESGNYKISGLTISDKKQNDDNYIYLTLEAGKAYVRGYEVVKPTAYTIRLKRPTDLRDAEGEAHSFTEGNLKYLLSYHYANNIKRVQAYVKVTRDNMTKTSLGIDNLPLTPVVRILSISSGNTEYVQDVDYRRNGNQIEWLPGGNSPLSNTSYSCTWIYNKRMEKDVDYKLTHSEDWYKGYIEFTPEGDKPSLEESMFTIDYDYMLYRRDTIGIDMLGNIIVSEGQSDGIATVESPSVDPEHILALGSVLLTPASNDVTIINNDTKTITMLELYTMLERINDLEYNQAITDLDQEAAENEDSTKLKGIFTDGFIGFTKSDLTHKDYTASIDLDSRELTVPYKEMVFSLTPDSSQSNNRFGQFNRILTNPYTEIILLSQPLVSDAMLINSYNAFPTRPTLTINPKVDNWIENQEIVIQGQDVNTTATLRRWWHRNHINAKWAASERAKWQALGFADGRGTDSEGNYMWSSSYTAVQQMSSVENVTNSIIAYMRVKTINITLQKMQPNVDNIVATFNGVSVNLTPKQTKYKGTKTGTLKADNKGNSYGSFTIPAKTLCGTVEVRAYPENAPSFVGVDTYTAEGVLTTTTRKIWTQTTAITAKDPLAQSFQFEQDQYLTSVGLYFQHKDLNADITVQIRNITESGFPGTTMYAEKVIPASSIKVSDVAAQETKIVFDNPVYCEAKKFYCFTILTESDSDALWYAENQKIDITSKAQISKNPYLNGVMYSSSNNFSWTIHQNSDLKFNLYGARFETSGQITFEPINANEMDRILVIADESIPTGCSVNWNYSINGTDRWLPIESYSDRNLSEVASSVTIKCSFTGTTTSSPAIALDSLVFVGMSNELQCTYISRNVTVPKGFNNIKVMLDYKQVEGAGITVSYATDISGNTWIGLENPTVETKNALYKILTFEKSLDAPATNYRIRIDLTTNNRLNYPCVQNLKNILKTEIGG